MGGTGRRGARAITQTTTIAAKRVPLSEATARPSDLVRQVRQQHERIILTRDGEAEAVLLSVDDLDGLEMTLESLGDSGSVAASPIAWPLLAAASPGQAWRPYARTWPGVAPPAVNAPADRTGMTLAFACRSGWAASAETVRRAACRV